MTQRFLLFVCLFISAWIPACSLFAAGEDGVRDRAEFTRSQLSLSRIDPAAARLSAWFDSKSVPYYRDRDGSSPLWEEIGPSVLLQGWGGVKTAGRLNSVLIDPRDPKVIYTAAASGGIWKSTDAGKSWKPISDHEASPAFGALAFDPYDADNLYAGTGEPHFSLDSLYGAGLLRSRDAGKNWTLHAADLFLGHRFYRILPHPRYREYIYAATTLGLFRSIDGGNTWVRLLEGTCNDVIMHPRNPNWILAAMGSRRNRTQQRGLFRSLDAGDHWEQLITGLPDANAQIGRIHVGMCLAQPQALYAIYYGSPGLIGVFKSTDTGETWKRLPNAPDCAGGQWWYDLYIAVHPTNPSVVFVGGLSSWRTMDGGLTWNDSSRSYGGGFVHPDHHYAAWDPHDTNTLYLCTDGGLYRTRNLGENWEELNTGLATIQFQSVDVHPWDKNIAYGGTQDNGTNKYTGNLEWLHVFGGDGGTTRVNYKNPNVVYTEYVNLAIFRSNDAAENWNFAAGGIDRSEGALFYAPYAMDPNDPEILIAGTRRLWRTVDGTANWKSISPVLGNRVSAIAIAPGASGVIYGGTTNGKVWVTPNTGTDWYDVSAGIPSSYIGDIAIDPRSPRIAYVGTMSYGVPHVFKTKDAGGAWVDVTDNLPDTIVRGIVLHPRDPDLVYLATEIGVFVSETGGKRWYRLGRNLPNVPVYSIIANARTGYVTIGTHGRGAWRIPLPPR